ncbi:MFS transporter [Gleimia hominis]|uniref:MFS transporter n=1 Tax=Gleimia hominis TaxID=595468 RepID=UPI001E4086F3|nr:MFS transporter [Gleimia hominis]WIK64064.1 MFS transporter [Gleimia hominis]
MEKEGSALSVGKEEGFKQPDENNSGEIRIPGVKRVFTPSRILVVLLVPLAMSLVAVSSVNVALPTIGKSLQASDASLQWVLSGYALAIGISLIPAGRLGDLFGRGLLFQIGLVIFTIGSALCAISSDPTHLNIFRIIQGIGGGIYSPQIMGIIQQTFSGQARARAFGLFGMVVAVAVAVGPPIAGAIINLFGPTIGWRYTFMMYLPLGLLGIALAFIWLPFERERMWIRRRRARKQARRDNRRNKRENRGQSPAAAQPDATSGEPRSKQKIDLDPVGALLVTAAVLGIMLPFTSHTFKWWLLLVFAAGIGLLFAWYAWENWYKNRGNYAMVDPDLLRIPSFSFGTAVSGAYFLGSTSIFVISAIFLQNGLAFSALAAGSFSVPNALVSMFAARWSSERALTWGRSVIQIALGTMMVGTALTAVVVACHEMFGLSIYWVILTLAILGFGQGAVGSANQTLSLDEVPVKHGGAAGGVKQTVERLATAIGNAIITAVFFAAVPAVGYSWGTVTALCIVLGIQTIAISIGWVDKRRADRLRK